MKADWALAFIAYPLSRVIIPALTFGRVRVAAWDRRGEAPWSVRRTGRARLELGPDLAGILVCGIVVMEAFSLANAVTMLQTLQDFR